MFRDGAPVTPLMVAYRCIYCRGFSGLLRQSSTFLGDPYPRASSQSYFSCQVRACTFLQFSNCQWDFSAFTSSRGAGKSIQQPFLVICRFLSEYRTTSQYCRFFWNECVWSDADLFIQNKCHSLAMVGPCRLGWDLG